MRLLFTLTITVISFSLWAQTASIRGQLQDADGAAVIFANVVLYNAADSTLAKVETSDETGVFQIKGIAPGDYFISASYVGANDLNVEPFQLKADQELDLGVLAFQNAAIELEAATVTAERVMVEVKPDRTVFNVDGTINSTGSDAMNLLRKAPGVLVDNNENIVVLGRSGVLVYLDGKRLPITGDDLANFLSNIPADQIDRIDIITNPGAKYEAEGNAGIIDIRLKKDKNLGSNGSVNSTFSQGRYAQFNVGANGNYRNKFMNVFGSVGFADGESYNDMLFISRQNGLFMDEFVDMRNSWMGYNARLGTDFFIGENHTLGFLLGGRWNESVSTSVDRVEISTVADYQNIDSILIADNCEDDTRDQNTINLNYRFDNKKGRVINVDGDFGRFLRTSDRVQPNRYYDANEEALLSEIINTFDTPTDIDIYTFTVDYEDNLWGGRLGAGTKISRVVSDNTFLFYDLINDETIRNDRNSNTFEYTENVYAGYLNYSRQLSEKWNFSAGVRAEQTDAVGDLQAFLDELQEPPVKLNYLNFFPSAGLTYQINPKQTLALNYGRRINRPDYNVLNPFENQLSQLSYEKGNPFLRPEIVNNIELGYTLAWRYNFKLAYSKTTDQITRLIAPDADDPRAGFITWENLAEQTIIGFNFSAPVQITKKWSAYFNASASFLDNQADYGDGAVVDVQAFTYSIYQQHTFDLPAGFKGEISGWYSGPGVWGGVFEYQSSWSLDVGLQRRFFNDQMNVRISASDLFFQSGWDGISSFDGLTSLGAGNWDSRRVAASVSYRFGNQNVKSRKRKTGLESEADRVGSGD